jgi:hypothetical protein
MAASTHLLLVALQYPLHVAHIRSHVPISPVRLLVRETSSPREHVGGQVDKRLSHIRHKGKNLSIRKLINVSQTIATKVKYFYT